MSLQIDFVIAIGLFFVVFMLVIGATNSYFSSSMENTHINTLRENSEFLSNAILSRQGELSIATKAFKIEIDLYTASDTDSEIVTFDMSDYQNDPGIDYNSVTVFFPETNTNIVPSGNKIKTFAVPLEGGKKKTVYIYFDDDSKFSAHGSSFSGDDDATETVWPPTAIDVIQYEKILDFQNNDYDVLRTNYDLEDFHITIEGLLEYGSEVPEEGDVVSVHVPVLFQKRSGEIGSGNLIVYSW